MRGSSQALGGMPKARSIFTATASDGDFRPDSNSEAWLTLTCTVRATSVGRRVSMVRAGDFMPPSSHMANHNATNKFADSGATCGGRRAMLTP